MEIWLEADTWLALVTLAFLEIVLGIDNIIFISLVVEKLPEERRQRARLLGLILALIFRIGMLVGISYMVQMKEPLFEISDHEVSIRDILLMAGGLFLLAKSTSEIHHKVENKEERINLRFSSFHMIIAQIVVLDIIFSLDSVLTAVGMVDEISIMVIAVVLAMIVMIIFAKSISNFINKNPALQVLALSFLILIGMMLVLDAMHYEIPKGYIYFAVFFSLVVELLNLRLGKNRARKSKEDTD